MALSPFTKQMFSNLKLYASMPVRSLTSRQLMYQQFGEPQHVVKIQEREVAPLQPSEVLVRMLAAPVNPADINTIQGSSHILPKLPTVGGDEGVGEVVEIGKHVIRVKCGDRVVLTKRQQGSWRYYGAYGEKDVYVISPNLPLPEASMLTIAPCAAYRMLTDFRKLKPAQTVVQNASNSPCGQCVIQICKAWGINTLNIVASHVGFEAVKKHLLALGATMVVTLEEAEELCCFNTSLERPILALNCLGGSYEDVMLKLLQKNGTIVYYGCSYNIPLSKQYLRVDVSFNKFNLLDWDASATSVQKGVMLNALMGLMVVGKLKAPMYKVVELQNYMDALQNTVDCEAFARSNYVFDLTMPH